MRPEAPATPMDQGAGGSSLSRRARPRPQALAGALAALTTLGWGIPAPVAAQQPLIRRPPSLAQSLETLQSRLYRNRDHLERRSRRLTLAQAVATGLAQNPILAKAHAGIAATNWSGVAIRREWAPSLKVDNNDPGLLGVQQDQSDTLSIASPQLTLEWTFFDPSRLPRSKANAASLDADRFLFDVEARSLVLSLQQGYIDLQTLLTLEVEYRGLSAMVDGWLRLAKIRGRGGAVSPDVDQLTSQQLALLILRIDTHEKVIVAASRLARVLSLPPGELVMPSEPLALQGEWTLSRDETIQQALRLREEIQQSLASARSLAWSAVATLGLAARPAAAP